MLAGTVHAHGGTFSAGFVSFRKRTLESTLAVRQSTSSSHFFLASTFFGGWKISHQPQMPHYTDTDRSLENAKAAGKVDFRDEMLPPPTRYRSAARDNVPDAILKIYGHKRTPHLSVHVFRTFGGAVRGLACASTACHSKHADEAISRWISHYPENLIQKKLSNFFFTQSRRLLNPCAPQLCSLFSNAEYWTDVRMFFKYIFSDTFIFRVSGRSSGDRRYNNAIFFSNLWIFRA